MKRFKCQMTVCNALSSAWGPHTPLSVRKHHFLNVCSVHMQYASHQKLTHEFPHLNRSYLGALGRCCWLSFQGVCRRNTRYILLWDVLHTHVVILVFCTQMYLASKACARELCRAIDLKKPLVTVLEPESSRGGLSREAIEAQWTAMAQMGRWTFDLVSTEVWVCGPGAVERGYGTLSFEPFPNAGHGLAAFVQSAYYLAHWVRGDSGEWQVRSDIAVASPAE